MTVLTAELARDIVQRTMQIIPFNVNVMDERGAILGSGDESRVGQLHDGALLALAQRRAVEIDEATAEKLHGVKPGVNLPLKVNGAIVGVVGVTGAPAEVRQFGELVCLAAEMILEQAHLAGALQRDLRHREAFVLELIRCPPGGEAALDAWARRLGFQSERAHAVVWLQLNRGAAVDDAQRATQHLLLALSTRWPKLLCAALDPYEMTLILACDDDARAREAELHRRLQELAAWVREKSVLPATLSLGISLSGSGGVAQSWRCAQTTARIGAQRCPDQSTHSYYDLVLPVLLSGLDQGWQAEQLRQPLLRISQSDRGLMRRTLEVWLAQNCHPGATARALHIHRNTLDYRLRRIAECSGFDLNCTEDRLRLYVALLLDA